MFFSFSFYGDYIISPSLSKIITVEEIEKAYQFVVEVAKTGKPVVLVLENGRAVDLSVEEIKKIYDKKTNMVCYETIEHCKITCSKCGHTWSEINYI